MVSCFYFTSSDLKRKELNEVILISQNLTGIKELKYSCV